MGNAQPIYWSNKIAPSHRLPAEDIRYLAFSGGGARVAAALGVLEAHQAATNRPLKLYGVSGASGGAILAFFLAIGMPLNELIARYYQRPFQNLMDHLSPWIDCSGSVAVFDPKELSAYLESVLVEFNLRRTTPFSALRTDLYIVAWDTERNCTQVFSKHTTPEVSIVEATVSSAAIPTVFHARKVWVRGEERCFSDGAINMPLPIQLMPKAQTLGIYVYTAGSSTDFLQTMPQSCWNHTIKVDASNFGVLQVNPTPEQMDQALTAGRRAYQEYYYS